MQIVGEVLKQLTEEKCKFPLIKKKNHYYCWIGFGILCESLTTDHVVDSYRKGHKWTAICGWMPQAGMSYILVISSLLTMFLF